MRRAIFHIGTEKTGSTSIQRTLLRNSARMQQLGIAIPSFGKGLRHSKFVAYAAEDEKQSNLRKKLGVLDGASLEDFRDAFRNEFEAEVRRSPASTELWVFSTELAHSALTSSHEIRRLRELLALHFQETTIIVYLRRQDELAISTYSERIRQGAIERDVLPPVEPGNSYFNYEALLDRWRGIFGADRIAPCLYSKKELLDGDVVCDFLSRCGIEDPAALDIPKRQNVSLAGHAQEFLRQINERIPRPEDDVFNRARGDLVRVLTANFQGQGGLPTRQAAVDFLAKFEASNERVREQWFPQRSKLFSDDMSMYPVLEDPPPPFERAVEIAAELWRAHLAHVSKLEAQIAKLQRRPEGMNSAQTRKPFLFSRSRHLIDLIKRMLK